MTVRRIKMTLFDTNGNRLYCTPDEVDGFIKRAYLQRPAVRTLAETLVQTGCRISEALELTPARIELPKQDGEPGRVIIRSLKKRREDVFRAIPVLRSISTP